MVTRTTKKLTELGYVGRGKSKHRPRNDQSLYGGKYPFIQTGDVKETQLYISKYSQTYNEKGLAQSKLWNPGTLLITIAANIAETAILKIPACFPDSIVGFVPNKDTDVRFVKYYIDFIKRNIQAVSMGTTQDNLSLDKLSSFNYETPDYVGQQKIASILSAYDDLIENNNKRIKILEQIAKSIYIEWFENSHDTFMEVELSKLVTTQYGYTESAKVEAVGPYYLRGTDINKKSYIVWDEVPFCPINETDYKKYKLEDKDIVVIRMADPGKIGIVEKQINAVFASYLIRLRIIDDKITPYYLFYFLISDIYQNFIKGASNGTTRQSASAKVITDIKIPVPSIELQNKFEEKVKKIRELIINLVDKNTVLKKTKNLLLPKLISGELDIGDLDIKIRPEIL